MKKIELRSKKNNHFIGCWQMENQDTMDKIIDFFENNPKRHEIGISGHGKVDKEKKESVDLTIMPKELSSSSLSFFIDYFQMLQNCYWDYINDWSFLKDKWGEMYIGPFNIQKYNK